MPNGYTSDLYEGRNNKWIKSLYESLGKEI